MEIYSSKLKISEKLHYTLKASFSICYVFHFHLDLFSILTSDLINEYSYYPCRIKDEYEKYINIDIYYKTCHMLI